jgi:hypothetical protein
VYEPGIHYTRTDEEFRDVFLAWQRDDRAFFAAGACHILAHQFLSLHYGEDYEFVLIRPRRGRGFHAFAGDGRWAFDFNGWTREEELLRVHEAAYRETDPDWSYQRVVPPGGLPAYLRSHDDLRPPEFFPELPWTRAYNYVKLFPPAPPEE